MNSGAVDSKRTSLLKGVSARIGAAHTMFEPIWNKVTKQQAVKISFMFGLSFLDSVVCRPGPKASNGKRKVFRKPKVRKTTIQVLRTCGL